jgi:hypothetical protein
MKIASIKLKLKLKNLKPASDKQGSGRIRTF